MAGTQLDRRETDPSRDPLWARIEAYEFDALDPGEPFAARLAREHLWPPACAERVLEEYRRFCYLAVRAGHAVAPSEAVDQAWHQHLAHTRSYWQEFCAKVLELELHHEPARGDEQAATAVRDAYRKTLTAYTRISGERPPEDIWPPPALRFAGDDGARRVNARDYLIIRRPSKGMLWVVQLALVLAAFYFLWQGTLSAAVIAGAGAAVVSIYRDRTDNRWKTRPWRDGEDGGLGTGGCSTRGIS